MKTLVFLLISHFITSQPSEATTNFLRKMCSEMDIETRIAMIEEKKKVVNDKPERNVDNPDSDYTYIGKGGYSRVFFDKTLQKVAKMIKARKVNSYTSMISITVEILRSYQYSVIHDPLGTVEFCKYSNKLDKKFIDVLILYMDLLKGYDLRDLIDLFDDSDDLDF